MNALLNGLVNRNNLTLTENGALTYKSTLNGVLDFFAMGGALRTRSASEVENLFIKAYSDDKLLAMKALFNVRNIRGGAGERKTFRTILMYLGYNHPEVVLNNLENIPKFGRWDDLFILLDTPIASNVYSFIADQFLKDCTAYKRGESISLLAKWLPSINTSSKKTVDLAHKMCKEFDVSPKIYRQSLSKLRAYIKVVERDMSANEWKKIDYSKVPSQASKNYRKAFVRNDQLRYQQFLAAVQKGEAKINAGTLFPYEIVRDILYKGDRSATLDAQWNALPNYLEGNDRNILAVVDVSGSMMSPDGLPMATSIALGMYTAERNKGPFHNYFITFTDIPQLQKVTGTTIYEKIRSLQGNCGYSTDLQRVFIMLLNTAIRNQVTQEDMPAQILVITDVEFNDPQNGRTNLETIKIQYAAAGYEMPQLVFWNVNSKKNNVPATANEKGVLLVSGSSPSVFKTLLTGKQYTPIDQMLETLNQEMYNSIVA